MKLWVKQGFLVNPATETSAPRDLYIEDGIIRRVAQPGEFQPPVDCGEVNAGGCVVVPGLIDLHVHFRDPGNPEKEDTASGCRAAARGGYTTVCCMPNTNPPLDNPDTVLHVDRAAREANGVNVLPVGAMTRGQLGTLPAPYEELDSLATRCRELIGHGIVAVSEDGRSVDEAALMRDLMERARDCGLPVFSHAEESSLVGGAMHLGKRSKELEMVGLSAEAEEIIVARDILLAKMTGCRLHFCHISTAASLDLIRLGKAWGVSVTAETAPHYFTLSDQDVTAENGLAKMNPPLRDRADVSAVRKALADGTLDAIATDHAPHTAEEKARPLKTAPFGIVGLETAFSLGFTELVESGILQLSDLIRLMSLQPARIIGLNRGDLREGAVADLAIFDTSETFAIDPGTFASKSRGTPFAGRRVKGRTVCTVVEGRVLYHD